MLNIKDIRIRDPFILTDFENKCYYMYGTTAIVKSSIDALNKFHVYKSYDLVNFEDAKEVFDGSKENFWATKDYWAAEVHKYKGKYYLFGSVKSNDAHRATQIFVCDTPDGKFKPLSNKARTPLDWECLDGTLYIDNGIPYMVFSHEWTQIKNGEICAIRLSDDLKETIGKPFTLFKASDNEFVGECGKDSGVYVTDGPFLFKEDGKINLIWSSFSKENGQYRMYLAQNDTLKETGWVHSKLNFNFDGGHSMIFKSLDGKKYLSLHSPNSPHDLERAKFIEL